MWISYDPLLFKKMLPHHQKKILDPPLFETFPLSVKNIKNNIGNKVVI